MPKDTLFPRVQSHAHYPEFLVELAVRLPAYGCKKVFSYWDKYTKACKQARKEVSKNEFLKKYNYDQTYYRSAY